MCGGGGFVLSMEMNYMNDNPPGANDIDHHGRLDVHQLLNQSIDRSSNQSVSQSAKTHDTPLRNNLTDSFELSQ